ncbi:MAG: radical SAM (seleno)protein TrsS [Desulfobacterales bacterium]
MARETTESLCPVCLRRIPAERVDHDGQVLLEKTCPDHGEFKTVIWNGPPHLKEWRRPKTPAPVQPGRKETSHGCPFDCGLCREHRQRSCTVLLEVTRRCNLRCPVCFADARPDADRDPGLDEIRDWYRIARKMAPGSNIQLSGGEPTLRDDLPDIVAEGRACGFGFIQLNTNGIRLANDAGYVKALKDAGLASVFLQFDGTDDAVHLELRGRALTDVKRRAIAACAACGIGVVLVPTLVPGVNTDQIGALLRLAIDLSPAVRGVHFQPVSYFGRCPPPANNGARLTLPELMRALEHQGAGMIRAADFHPPGCENAWCSFHAEYLTLPGGGLRRLGPPASKSHFCPSVPAAEGARRAIAHVARQWAGTNDCTAEPGPSSTATPGGGKDSLDGERMRLDDFLDRARAHTFSVSAMAFQDAWTIDLERLRDCCIHVLDPRYGLVPFCAYNLTARDGKAFYR